jgi:hypothetical protein
MKRFIRGFVLLLIILIASVPVLAAPGDVSGVTAIPTDDEVSLTWIRGSSSNTTIIRYLKTNYPTDPTGATDASVSAYSGVLFFHTETGLTGGTTYFFTLWAYDGTDYSANATAAHMMVTTYGTVSEGDSFPSPTFPASFNQTADSSGWFNKLQPFTGAIDYFATDWAMNKDIAMSLAVCVVIVVLSVILYVRWKNIFAAYGLSFILVLGATQLTLLPFWAIFVMLGFGLGIWGIERAYQ